ncbi:hypothetical protein B0H13DRAFT_1864274 [Mycena leptocephala]|nr:hypothetical protein B0H13DRAFT_1864274 [Mycena leptocephala]
MAGERRWWGPVVRRALPAVCRVRIGTKDGEGTRASPIADATSDVGVHRGSRVEARAPQAVTYLKSRAVGTVGVDRQGGEPQYTTNLAPRPSSPPSASRPSLRPAAFYRRLLIRRSTFNAASTPFHSPPPRSPPAHLPPVPLLGRTLLPFPTSPALPSPLTCGVHRSIHLVWRWTQWRCYLLDFLFRRSVFFRLRPTIFPPVYHTVSSVNEFRARPAAGTKVLASVDGWRESKPTKSWVDVKRWDCDSHSCADYRIGL